MQTLGGQLLGNIRPSCKLAQCTYSDDNFETRSIDFVLAFPQAEIQADVYMELPHGFEFEGSKKYILKLNKNLYGLCNASRTFWEFLQTLWLNTVNKQDCRQYDRLF